MRVISASRRTDVPAFYSRWLLTRLRAGFCHTANPFSGEVYRIGLAPDDVVALALFTRDPRPMLRHLPALTAEGYHVYGHVTLNGYPRDLEPRSPWLPRATAAMRQLGEVLGRENVVWRYDPIVLTDETPEAWHVARFAGLAEALRDSAGECCVSFVDRYRKSERNLTAAGVMPRWDDAPRQLKLAETLHGIAEENGIAMRACCEDSLAAVGAERAACVDRARAARMRPDLDLHLRSTPTRSGCGCGESADIGAYGTCAFGCTYCYATETPAHGIRRLREHDSADTILWRPPSLRGVDLDAVAVTPKEPDVRPAGGSLF
jgi:hypothetical protein